jgi:hypothetical protein
MSLSVTFSETGVERELRRACNRCYGRAVKVDDIETVFIVSQYGTVHQQNPDYDGRTLCGIDATGEQWWWRE